MNRFSPFFRIVVGIVLVAITLFALAQLAHGSDLRGSDGTGPTVEVLLYTQNADGTYGVRIIRLPDGKSIGVLPGFCIRKARQPDMYCMILKEGGGAYMKQLYLKELDT